MWSPGPKISKIFKLKKHFQVITQGTSEPNFSQQIDPFWAFYRLPKTFWAIWAQQNVPPGLIKNQNFQSMDM